MFLWGSALLTLKRLDSIIKLDQKSKVKSSADLNVIVDLIAGIKTVRALELRITNQDQLFSIYRRRLVLSSFGLFTTRLWARHIHDRFRDAVAVTAPSHTPHFPDPDREITRDFHLSRSHARPQHCGPRRSA